jgi:hypothetical protein
MRGTSKPAALRLAVAVLLAWCAGCSSSTPRANPSTASADGGTVTGTLRLAGGPPPGIDRATTGEVYAFPSPGLTGQPQVKAETADDGSFHLNVPAGTYYLAATSPDFSIDPPPATPPCRADKPAVVSRGGTSRVDVVCQLK